MKFRSIFSHFLALREVFHLFSKTKLNKYIHLFNMGNCEIIRMLKLAQKNEVSWYVKT